MAVFQDLNLTDGVNMVPDFITGTLGFASSGGVNVVGIVIAFALFFVFYGAAKTFSFPLAMTGASFIVTFIIGAAAKLGYVPAGAFMFSAFIFVVALIIALATSD